LHGLPLLDAASHHAYFCTYREPGQILKVSLGNGDSRPPEVVGALVLEPEEDKPFNAVIGAGYAYFATDLPGKVVKVGLGDGNDPPYRVGSVLLDPHYNARVGVVDSATGYGCFSVADRLYKLWLGKGDETPAVVAHVELPNAAMGLVSAVLDPTTHYAYLQLPQWSLPNADSIVDELLGWLHQTAMSLLATKATGVDSPGELR